MDEIHTLGMVLHPHRDHAQAVDTILAWAAERDVRVLGVSGEVSRLHGSAVAVPSATMSDQADLIIGVGGDGTVLRAMRIADRNRVPVLGVNLGTLGFLAEVDIPELNAALTAIGHDNYRVEPHSALDAAIGERRFTAFNDVVAVRVPGDGAAAVALAVQGQHFVSYAADAVIVATPTGSTAYNFSAGGPIVAPSVAGILVTPSASHSVFNRSMIVDIAHVLRLTILPSSGRLAVEVDGAVAAYVSAGDHIDVKARPDAAHVVRLGWTTFYQRTQRKLGIIGPAELNPPRQNALEQ